MASYKLKGKVNIGRVISHVVTTVITLWVGGTILAQVGDTIVGECSPFFEGLELIGWEVGTNTTAYAATCPAAGNPSACDAAATANSSLSGQIDPICEAHAADTIVYDTGDSGVLSVLGLIGLAAIVLEFVEFKL